MSGVDLRQARRARGWTQQEVARRLDVSQGYLSLLERERRNAPAHLRRRLQPLLELPPTALPAEETPLVAPSAERLARSLSALGYAGFAYLRSGARRANPATVLLQALSENDLEPRLAAALPWLAWRYVELDWGWLLDRARLRDLQNRLGFTVSLARRLGECAGLSDRVAVLKRCELALERSRLAREDTYCRDSMTEAERRWLREHRPAEAARWNLLTNLTVATLPYAPS